MKKSDDAAKKDPIEAKLKELKSLFKDYEALKKEYDLTEEQLTTKAIMQRMGETLEGYIKILIQLLQPEEFHSLHECTAFDDTEKEKIFDIYKNLMIAHRELLKAEIKNDEKNNVSTIGYVNSELKRLKPDILVIVNKMQESWNKKLTKGKERYFG